jgi:hypothetical protein
MIKYRFRSPPSRSGYSIQIAFRLIGNLWDDGHRPTALSVDGRMSGNADFDQRSPDRTLGAFVPTNSTFLRTLRDIQRSDIQAIIEPL